MSPGSRNTISGNFLNPDAVFERGVGSSDMLGLKGQTNNMNDQHGSQAKGMDPIYERRTTLGVRTPARLALDRLDRNNREEGRGTRRGASGALSRSGGSLSSDELSGGRSYGGQGPGKRGAGPRNFFHDH